MHNRISLVSGVSSPPAQEVALELARYFAVFRPSERQFVRGFFSGDDKKRILFQALISYLDRMGEGDRADAYRARLIGKWFGKNAPLDFMETFENKVSEELKSERNAESGNPYIEFFKAAEASRSAAAE